MQLLLIFLVSLVLSNAQQCRPLPKCAVEALSEFEKKSLNLIRNFNKAEKEHQLITNALQLVTENFIQTTRSDGIEDLNAFVVKSLLEIETILSLAREQFGQDTMAFTRLGMRITSNALRLLSTVLSCE